MNCDDVNELYLASLRSFLSPDEAKEFQEHINACDKCRKIFLLDKTIVTTIQNVPLLTPRENFVSIVCKRVSIQKENIRLTFRHLLIFSMGLLVIFSAVGILWRDFLFRVFTYIFNYSLSQFTQVNDTIQNIFNLLLTASSYQKTITQLPYHLSWVFWILFVGSIVILISLLFSFNIYPIKKSTKSI